MNEFNKNPKLIIPNSSGIILEKSFSFSENYQTNREKNQLSQNPEKLSEIINYSQKQEFAFCNDNKYPSISLVDDDDDDDDESKFLKKKRVKDASKDLLNNNKKFKKMTLTRMNELEEGNFHFEIIKSTAADKILSSTSLLSELKYIPTKPSNSNLAQKKKFNLGNTLDNGLQTNISQKGTNLSFTPFNLTTQIPKLHLNYHHFKCPAEYLDDGCNLKNPSQNYYLGKNFSEWQDTSLKYLEEYKGLRGEESLQEKKNLNRDFEEEFFKVNKPCFDRTNDFFRQSFDENKNVKENSVILTPSMSTSVASCEREKLKTQDKFTKTFPLPPEINFSDFFTFSKNEMNKEKIATPERLETFVQFLKSQSQLKSEESNLLDTLNKLIKIENFLKTLDNKKLASMSDDKFQIIYLNVLSIISGVNHTSISIKIEQIQQKSLAIQAKLLIKIIEILQIRKSNVEEKI